MLHSARRINALAPLIGAKKYLEIGVLTGQTFLNVAIEERTGVDPSLHFDVAAVINDKTRLLPLTSDAFFAAEPLTSAFDVAFIDGMHTFEQVVRDFANAIVYTHRRSVIMLDDTLPNDVYSTNPDQAAGMKYRRAAGSQDISWHGDVFKTVFYLHDFWPSLNYRTITGSGNPQTLVWRAANTGRTARYNDLERISRLTFFDLMENLDVLQVCPEDEAIRLCAEEIEAQ
jgi:hypothetical protein